MIRYAKIWQHQFCPLANSPRRLAWSPALAQAHGSRVVGWSPRWNWPGQLPKMVSPVAQAEINESREISRSPLTNLLASSCFSILFFDLSLSQVKFQKNMVNFQRFWFLNVKWFIVVPAVSGHIFQEHPLRWSRGTAKSGASRRLTSDRIYTSFRTLGSCYINYVL